MTRTIVRAFACSLIFIALAVGTAASSAIAAPGDNPYFSNQTTGFDPSVPGAYRTNVDEVALGDRLQGQSSDWAGTGTYTYSWQRCFNTAGDGCTQIAGATSATYVVVDSDLAKTVMFCAQAASGTMCSARSPAVIMTHTDTDGDGYEDYRDNCYQQTGVRTGGCPDYSRQPTVMNSTTGGDVDAELAANDLLEGDASPWASGVAPFHYEFRRCTDKACEQGSEFVFESSFPQYRVRYNDYGFFIEFCALGADWKRMCSEPVGTSSGVVASHTDSDKDGVADYKDKCPSAPALTDDGCPMTVPVGSTASPAAADTSSSSAGPAGSAPPVAASPQPNGAGADRAAQLTAMINNRSRALKVGFGKKATINGRLVDAYGKAIAGAELVVLTKRNVASAQFSKPTSVKTDASGRFRYRAPAGPSRVVRIGYFAFAGDSLYADAADVTLLVAGSLTLNAPKHVANKRAAAFSGTVKGRPLPKGGVLVDLQVWFHGKWRTFATPRTNAKGTFRFKYRFTQGAAKWSFRARVRKDSLYPYELAYSRKLAVTVTR